MKFEKLILSSPDLTFLESELAHYILDHRNEVIQQDLQTLSQSSYTSRSTILRLCKKLGYRGFNELKIQLAKESLEDTDHNASFDVNYPFLAQDPPLEIARKIQTLYQTTIQDTLACLAEQDLLRAAHLLHEAKVIDIYTHAHNTSIAQSFQDKMMTIRHMVNLPLSFYSQRLCALASDPSHVALCLSYSGKASFLGPILKKMKEKKVPVILISKVGPYSSARNTDIHLSLSDNEQLRDRISQYASHMAMQYVIDVLYGCIYNLDRIQNQQILKDSIDFMDDRSI